MSNRDSITEATRAVVQRFYDCILAADFEGVLSFHEDIEIHEPECLPYGGIYKGKEGALKLFPEATKFLDVKAFKVEAIIADGNRAVGMLAAAVVGSGQSVKVAEESIIRDGKIYRVNVFQFDPTLVSNAAKNKTVSRKADPNQETE